MRIEISLPAKRSSLLLGLSCALVAALSSCSSYDNLTGNESANSPTAAVSTESGAASSNAKATTSMESQSGNGSTPNDKIMDPTQGFILGNISSLIVPVSTAVGGGLGTISFLYLLMRTGPKVNSLTGEFEDMKVRMTELEQRVREFAGKINTYDQRTLQASSEPAINVDEINDVLKRNFQRVVESANQLSRRVEQIEKEIKRVNDSNSMINSNVITNDPIIEAMSSATDEPPRNSEGGRSPSFLIGHHNEAISTASEEITTEDKEQTRIIENLVSKYNDALNRNDRSAIRTITEDELNVTAESDEALVRGTTLENTQLNVVTGGGSYLLVRAGEKRWVVPTLQTFLSYSTYRPAKGIFEYDEQSVSTPALIKPAEVEQVGDKWEVVRMGVVAVPI